MAKCTIIIILFSIISLGYGEIYSSFMNVQNLNYLEDHLLDLLKDYIAKEKERIGYLENFYNYVYGSKVDLTPDTYISYPTNQFNVIHRFVSDWNNLESYTKEIFDDPLFKAMHSYESLLPNDDDVAGAVKALHRLQDIYKITAEHFAAGWPLERERQLQGQPLDVKSLLRLTKTAYEEEDWRKCAAWGRQAYLNILKNNESPLSSTWFDVLDYFTFCLYKIDELSYAKELTELILEHYPEHERIGGNLRYFKKELATADQDSDYDAIYGREKRSLFSEPLPFLGEIREKENVNITYVPKIRPGADKPNMTEDEIEYLIEDKEYNFWAKRMRKYRSLCKESAPLTPEMEAQKDRLICYYKGNTPRSLIKPIKVEEAWPSPKILIFHDMVSDDEAKQIMDLAKPLLNRATVHNKLTGKLENADYRVSKTAWLDVGLYNDREDVVRRVNRRMEDATELSLELAELQQVNNYGMAGQYEPHYDMATKGEKAFSESDGGNRIATLLFYMGNTEAGGATAFIDAGARIAPRKNAAVFWYNLLPNGDPDLLTRHAGCPVLAGTKWVMNKWIHVNDQVFTRPCDVDRYRREKPAKLYNGHYTQ